MYNLWEYCAGSITPSPVLIAVAKTMLLSLALPRNVRHLFVSADVFSGISRAVMVSHGSPITATVNSVVLTHRAAAPAN